MTRSPLAANAMKLCMFAFSGTPMSVHLHEHGHVHACDCAAHRARTAPKVGLWPSLLPVLACAVCPACLATYAKLFSALGVGFGLSERQHVALLIVAVTASVLVSAWRTWRAKRIWPLAIALTGSSLVLFGHFAGDLHLIEWAGMLCLLGGGLTEQLRLRRLVPSHA